MRIAPSPVKHWARARRGCTTAVRIAALARRTCCLLPAPHGPFNLSLHKPHADDARGARALLRRRKRTTPVPTTTISVATAVRNDHRLSCGKSRMEPPLASRVRCESSFDRIAPPEHKRRCNGEAFARGIKMTARKAALANLRGGGIKPNAAVGQSPCSAAMLPRALAAAGLARLPPDAPARRRRTPAASSRSKRARGIARAVGVGLRLASAKGQ